MTKDEYQDFALRYKGCGACFPMYHTLSRFEKMWFTAIQKDVAELEKENAELKKKLKPENCLKLLAKGGYIKFTSEQLTKAKELLAKWVELFKPKGGNIPPTPIQIDTEQFLSEVEK